MSAAPAGTARVRAAPFLLAFLAAACTPTAQAPPAQPTGTYPFADVDGLPVLSVGIGNGPPLRFLLDTGASPCVLDAGVAVQHGIPTAPSTREREGGAGTFRSDVALEPVTLRIGSSTLTCSATIAADLSSLTGALGGPLHGIVGGDFFRGRVVAIDYRRDVVETFERDAFRDAGGTERIPIRVAGNRPYVTAILSVHDGPQDVARELLIDTGSSDHVDDSLLLQSRQPLRTGSATGLGSGGRVQAGTFASVRIGPHSFYDVPGVVPNVPIVGAGILARFRLILDYDRGWMVLEPPPAG